MGASIGLQLSWDGADGASPLLVPAWFFTAEGSDAPIAIIAIDPRFLAPPTVPSAPSAPSVPSAPSGVAAVPPGD